MANLVPLGDHIVVKPMKTEATNSAGIILQERDEKPQKGEVIAVGEGAKKDDGTRVPMDVQVGDIVVFKKYSPDEFEMDGEKVLVMTESSVLAKVK